MKTFYRIYCFIALLTIAIPSMAFHINPTIRYDTLPAGHRFRENISEHVHESLTRASRHEYSEMCSKEEIVTEYCMRSERNVKTIQDSLIRGVWWADDPNQNLYKARALYWLAYMSDAERRAKGVTYVIDDKYMMQYRSHYGDMQFLHSMANDDGENPALTQKHILMWAEFMYEIATKKVVKTTKFKEVDVAGIEQFYKRQADWELGWIFQPRYLLRNPEDFGEHGLGIFFHMIQDSYSAAHTLRDFTASEQCPFGSIKQFYSYRHQDPKKHGEADTWSSYTLAKLPDQSNPVSIGAKLIDFVQKKADWNTEVLPYLKTHVYCLADDAALSGPGEYEDTISTTRTLSNGAVRSH